MGDIVAQEAILDTDRLDTEYEISTNLARYKSFINLCFLTRDSTITDSICICGFTTCIEKSRFI